MTEVYEIGLDVAAWERWLEYRKAIRKTLKPVSYPAAQKKLAKFGVDQAEVVEQSIAQGWTGLFPLRDGSNGASKQVGKPRIGKFEESTQRLRDWAERG